MFANGNRNSHTFLYACQEKSKRPKITKAAEDVIACGISQGNEYVEIFIERAEVLKWDLLSGNTPELTEEIWEGLSITVERSGKAAHAACETISPKSMQWCLQQSIKKLLDSPGPAGFSHTNNKFMGLDKHRAANAFDCKVNAHEVALNSLELLVSGLGPSHAYQRYWCQFWVKQQLVDVYTSEGINISDYRTKGHIFGEVFDRVSGRQLVERGCCWSGPFPTSLDKKIGMIAEECANSLNETHLRKNCPSYSGRVLVGSRLGGTLFHEAVGHMVEVDDVSAESHTLLKSLGKRIAPDFVNLVDDPTLDGGYGSQVFDDEGNATCKVDIIRNGILVSVLTNRRGAQKFSLNRTSSARRASYRFPTLARMSNTYLEPGEYSFEQLLKLLDRGLYIHKTGEAQVDHDTGRILIEVREGYWIEESQILYPVYPCTVITDISSLLEGIEAVGNDWDFNGVWCEKHGSTLQVGIGQPSLIIDNLRILPEHQWDTRGYNHAFAPEPKPTC